MTLTVTRIRCAHHHLPREAWWDVPIEDHTLAIDAIDLITCELETAEGVRGFGYTYTLQRGGSAVAALLADEIAPVLAGRTLARPEPVWCELWRRMLRFGRGGVVSVALAAADVALWDALAQAAGLPLHRFIGSHREAVPVYGSSIDLGFTQEALLATVEEWKRRGFTAVKVKVGRTLAEDLRRLAAVRELLGPDIALMVDANNGWDLPDAARRIAAMAPFDLTWVEEPLMPDDVDGHARLQAQSTTPIAAGESLFSSAEFARYLEADAMRYVQADVGRLGGITPWLAVARLAEARDLPMAPHFLHDLHVHLLCAVPNASVLEYLPLLDALLERPLAVDGDGLARPPLEPGTGVRFRSEALAPHLVSETVRTA
jgi:L-alanine-DL-glutamate epimerase-like enolase superfamily enzyme